MPKDCVRIKVGVAVSSWRHHTGGCPEAFDEIDRLTTVPAPGEERRGPPAGRTVGDRGGYSCGGGSEWKMISLYVIGMLIVVM